MKENTTITKFEGFPKETVNFIRGLGRNNNKQWFQEHRSEYEEFYIQPAKAFVISAGPALQKVAPKIQFEPRVNGSIYRINRDIRFSKDKTPYKEHMTLWFWEGESRKNSRSGFFLRLAPRKVFLGVGAHEFDRETLNAYRMAVTNPKSADKLNKAIKSLESHGLKVNGKHYKRLPKGFDVKKSHEELLLYNALWVSDSENHPSNLDSLEFIDHCITKWKKFAPLHKWIMDEIE
jgi:uncharacterized protein (TIGR02453 family)